MIILLTVLRILSTCLCCCRMRLWTGAWILWASTLDVTGCLFLQFNYAHWIKYEFINLLLIIQYIIKLDIIINILLLTLQDLVVIVWNVFRWIDGYASLPHHIYQEVDYCIIVLLLTVPVVEGSLCLGDKLRGFSLWRDIILGEIHDCGEDASELFLVNIVSFLKTLKVKLDESLYLLKLEDLCGWLLHNWLLLWLVLRISIIWRWGAWLIFF